MIKGSALLILLVLSCAIPLIIWAVNSWLWKMTGAGAWAISIVAYLITALIFNFTAGPGGWNPYSILTILALLALGGSGFYHLVIKPIQAKFIH